MVVPISLAISDAVSVNLSGGTPTLTLSDGATATYDVAASNPAGQLLVFDYTVGAADQAVNLAVAGVNTNGATIASANGKAVDFAASPSLPLGLQVGTPLTVSGVAVSASGEADAGQTVQITLQMSQAVSIALGQVAFRATGIPFGLQLNDGAVATYSATLSNLSAGTIVFTDTVANTAARAATCSSPRAATRRWWAAGRRTARSSSPRPARRAPTSSSASTPTSTPSACSATARSPARTKPRSPLRRRRAGTRSSP
jgi:phage baseplate assembly protein gpV